MIPYQRVIGKILVSDSFVGFETSLVAVISRRYKEYLAVANPLSLARILDAQVIDEVQLSWIGGLSTSSINHFYKLVQQVSSVISVPLAVSFRLSNFEDAAKLFSVGADKIIVSSNLFHTSSFLSQISSKYGCQSIVC